MKLSQFLSYLVLTCAATSVFAASSPYAAQITYQNATFISALLTYTGVHEYYIKPTNPWIKTLNFTAYLDGDSEAYIFINDTQKSRFSLPNSEPFPYTKTLPPISNPQIAFYLTQNPFSFAVVRVSTNETIFDTKNFDFVYSDLGIQFGTQLPSRFLYGLGERRSSYLYKPGTYSIYNKGGIVIDEGRPGMQTYGTYPVYMMREASRNWHVTLFRNTNAMDFTFDSNNGLYFKTIGGIIELKFFLGTQNPESVINQFHVYSNGYALTPFWSHGWHQSRWGMANYTVFENVVKNYAKNNLQLDTIWSDLDYMDNSQIFTYSPLYPAQNISQLLSSHPGLRWVPILNPGPHIGDNIAYQEGLKEEIYITSQNTGKPYVGRMWPGDVSFVDFSNPKSEDYWAKLLKYIHDQAPFSGIWLDMNQIGSWCEGECDQVNRGLMSEDLPYLPSGRRLEAETLSLEAILYAGKQKDMHNIYCLYHADATRKGLKKLGSVMPFVLSLSTALGNGAVAQHWSGDNWSSYDYFAASLPEIFSHQLFGNVMIGPDVCGFGGDATETLCSYWMQMISVYPFARGHNHRDSKDQMPFDMGPTLLETSRVALDLRYQLLKWQYSLFVRNGGVGTTFRPLFYEYPNDDYLLGLETQFLLGRELLGLPCLTDTTTCTAVAYFPNATKYFDFYNGSTTHDYANPAQNITVDIPLNSTLPLFIRAGSIVHKQNTTGVNSTLFLDNNFDLVVALEQVDDSTYSASGVMLNIKNYTDEQNVLDKCSTGGVNCLIRINVTGRVNTTTNALDISVTFSPENNLTTPFEVNHVTRIFFYGAKTVKCAIGNAACNSDFAVVRSYDVDITNSTQINDSLFKPSSSRVRINKILSKQI